MPRMMTFGTQEYVITPETIYILLSGSDHLRRIFTDGRDWPKNPQPTYGGYSIGRWTDQDGNGRYDMLEAGDQVFQRPARFRRQRAAARFRQPVGLQGAILRRQEQP